MTDFVTRRTVIEAYLRYDAPKKDIAIPAVDTWDWDDPNTLDDELHEAGFKCGILPGFLEWRGVHLTVEDLRSCAVVDTMSAGGPRDLRSLERLGRLKSPPERRSWSAKVTTGGVFGQDEPMILRPAVFSENPARWYLEDGSGRAAAIVANAGKYPTDQSVAFGYLGMRPDPRSRFMQTRFPSLLSGHAA